MDSFSQYQSFSSNNMTTELKPFTSSDLNREQMAISDEDAKKYIKETVEKIYHDVKKNSIEMNGSDYECNYTICWKARRNVRRVTEAIRQELVRLFPDFKVKIEIKDDEYWDTSYVCVRW
jgi:asparagine synthetase A